MTGPLGGLKVLDFTTLLPGPFATLLLADMGADVLRVLSPSRPDMAAFLPPLLPDGTSAVAAYLGRGKRCMHLNLKHPRAREAARRLAQASDVVVEQFRPGVMAALGLGYDDLAQANPGLVYCSITGYGQTGPLAHRAGHDINYLARAGVMSYSGRADSGPALLGVQVADLAGGSQNAVIGILAALLERGRTGQGQHVDVSMTDGAMAFNALAGAAYLAGGGEPARECHLLAGGCMYDFYETADGGWLAVGSLEPKFYAAFCQAIGRPELAGQGVMPADLAGVKAQVREIIAGQPLAHWEEVFAATDACVEPVLGLGRAYGDAHAQARQMVVETPLADGSTVRQPGFAIKFGRTPARPGPAAARPGQHTREVMAGLGYTEAELAELEDQGLFG